MTLLSSSLDKHKIKNSDHTITEYEYTKDQLAELVDLILVKIYKIESVPETNAKAKTSKRTLEDSDLTVLSSVKGAKKSKLYESQSISSSNYTTGHQDEPDISHLASIGSISLNSSIQSTQLTVEDINEPDFSNLIPKSNTSDGKESVFKWSELKNGMENFLDDMLKCDYSVVQYDINDEFEVFKSLFTGDTIQKALGDKNEVNIN
jgi:hypothetical protein